MVTFMRDIGKMDKNQDTEDFFILMEISIKENGVKMKLMEMENFKI